MSNIQNKGEVLPESSMVTDGITNGTPGYMAPEQAAGRNSELDERADIYSLGAILYAMLTWQDPLDQENIDLMLQKTVDGNIIPPKERAPGRNIPSALEAVVLKAMSLNPDNRYSSVNELQTEVSAYLGGFATNAEQATVIKKGFLFAKRNLITFISVCALVFLLLAGLVYSFQEKARKMIPWVPVYQQDFRPGAKEPSPPNTTQPIIKDLAGLYICDPWASGENGLILQAGEMLILPFTETNEIRAETEFSLPSGSDKITLMILNSAGGGYILETGALNNTFHRILRLDENGKRHLLNVLPCDNTNSSIRDISINWIISADRQTVQFTINREQPVTLEAEDFSTGFSAGLHELRLFADAETDVQLTELKLFRTAIARQPSPLLAGKIMEESGNYV